jgi:hypothetical protein
MLNSSELLSYLQVSVWRIMGFHGPTQKRPGTGPPRQRKLLRITYIISPAFVFKNILPFILYRAQGELPFISIFK